MRRFLLVLSFVFLGVISYSQGVIEKMIVDEATNTPTYIKFNTAAKALPVSKAADVLRQELQMPKEGEFKLYAEETDPVFGKLLRYQQYFQGVKVEFGRYYVHAQNGVIVSINGEYKPIEKFNINPSISEEQAFETAKRFIGAQKYAWETNNVPGYTKGVPKGELVIVEDINPAHRDTYMTYRLAYKFDIYATEPVSRDYVYVDAQTGKVLFNSSIIRFENRENNLSHKKVKEVKETSSVKTKGKADTRYSGSRDIETYYSNGSYLLRDYTRGKGIFTYNMHEGTDYSEATDFSDKDNKWTKDEYHNAAKDDAALDAHWATEMVYDYWKNVHGRKSFDNKNAALKSYVHYSSDYDNAYWNGSVMTYGDGSDTYFDALTSIDVCAHEIGHAVCDYTANFTYSNESGALDEGFADIWGACVEHYAAPEKQTWIMGEDIDKRNSNNPGLRSLSDPKSKGLPDTYMGENWYSGTSDHGGVHTNNGPIAYAFYLTSEGGKGTNDNGSKYDITGIGMDKAAKIFYRAESVYGTANTDYAHIRTYLIQAAEDLYGAGSQEVITVTNALYAIGVGTAYGEPAYCMSRGKNANYEWIAKVVVGNFTNTSSKAGYTDFTSKTINLKAGESYDIALTPGYASTKYDEYFKVWIDFNHDGDFTDDGELVYDAGGVTQSTKTGTISIPSSVDAVTTRMRVSMKYDGSQTSCEIFGYGEVEDYTVTIAAADKDTTAPSAPSSLSTSNLTSTSVDLSWKASTDNVGVTGYYIYKNGSYLASTTSTTYKVTGLTANTSYSFYVKAYDKAGNVSKASNTVSIKTPESSSNTSMPEGYCTSKGKDASYEWIDLVRLGDIDNSTGSDGGYKDYTNLSTTLTTGTEYKIYISAAFKSTSYTEYWAVYIDYNRDGDFEDTGEKVVSGSSSSDAVLYGTFTVPTTASLGTTRMRVSMKYKEAQTPCETFKFGEVEDYAVVLSSQSATFNSYFGTYGEELGNVATKEFSVYPNPVRTTFSVDITTDNNVKYIIYTTTGRQVKTGNITGSSNVINVSDLPAGIYTIRFNDGQKEIVKKLIKM